MKPKGPENEQACYELGYQNPSTLSRAWQWRHLAFVNAFVCGQADRQNQAPMNPAYSYEGYDPETFERKPPLVTEG